MKRLRKSSQKNKVHYSIALIDKIPAGKCSNYRCFEILTGVDKVIEIYQIKLPKIRMTKQVDTNIYILYTQDTNYIVMIPYHTNESNTYIAISSEIPVENKELNFKLYTYTDTYYSQEITATFCKIEKLKGNIYKAITPSGETVYIKVA